MRIQRNGIVQLSDLEQRYLWAYPFVLDMWINMRERLLTFHAFSCFWKCLLFRLWFIKVEHFKSYKKRPWTSILDQCWPKCDKFVYILSVCGFELQSKFMHVHEIWVLRSLVTNSSMFAEIGEWIKGLFAFLDFLRRKAVWLHLKNTEWFFGLEIKFSLWSGLPFYAKTRSLLICSSDAEWRRNVFWWIIFPSLS